MSDIAINNVVSNIEKLYIDYCKLFNTNNYTFSQFILNHYNYIEINNFIGILNTCNCCKRHTGYEYCLNLKKPTDYSYVKDDECDCQCRHYKRDLKLALNKLY